MKGTLHLTFRVGTADYALPASEVLHIESFDAATHVPGAADYVIGLVQVRGRVVPVVDLRRRFGLPAVPRELDHRVIVVQVGSRVAGLLVDSARDVLRIEASNVSPPPELVQEQASGFIIAIATLAKRMLLIVDVPRLIGEELP